MVGPYELRRHVYTSLGTRSETDGPQANLVAVRSQQQLAEVFEAQYSDAAAVLRGFRARLEAIEQANDEAAKRQIVELLVSRVRVDTETVDGCKSAHLTINYTFANSRACTDGLSIGTPITEPYSVQLPS